MKRMVALLLCCIVFFICCDDGRSVIQSREYYFSSGGVCFSIGDDATATAEMLGSYREFSRVPSCASNGYDEIYVYDGFRFFACPKGDESIIYTIELTNDTVTTSEGIRVGDSREKVIERYGGKYTSVGESIEYEGENCSVQFIIRYGKVSSIKYVSLSD